MICDTAWLDPDHVTLHKRLPITSCYSSEVPRGGKARERERECRGMAAGKGRVEWREQKEQALGGSRVSLQSNERVLELENRMFVDVHEREAT